MSRKATTSGSVEPGTATTAVSPGSSAYSGGMSGSSALVSWLLRHGLLDRLDLLVFPVVLGSGKRLFSEPDGPVPLTLTSSEAFGTGVVHLTYAKA